MAVVSAVYAETISRGELLNIFLYYEDKTKSQLENRR